MMAATWHGLVTIVFIIYSGVVARSDEVHKAKSILLPGNNAAQSSVRGTVEMAQHIKTGWNRTYIKISISGLPKNSVHGFHIHEFGDIISAGCSSAGGHYNPFNTTHGGMTDKIRHVGDLGNVYADENGDVEVVKMDRLVSLVGEYNVLGRALVLHQLEDDLGRNDDIGSKTTGNAGARIACGVIVRAPATKKT